MQNKIKIEYLILQINKTKTANMKFSSIDSKELSYINNVLDYHEEFNNIGAMFDYNEKNFVQSASNYLEDCTMITGGNYPPAELNLYGFIVALKRLNYIITNGDYEGQVKFVKSNKATISEVKLELMKLFTTFTGSTHPTKVFIIEDDDIHPTEPPMKFKFPCDPNSTLVEKVIYKCKEDKKNNFEPTSKKILPIYL